ncbi:hypothetical protein [Micromonospora fluostatini]|uniref:hypothetical protein n=1 Tax=Micromonospora sp. JCM 30529 TaxID=3421643 RepID=UPI003D1826F1
MHPVLRRLDDLAAHLATRPDVLAVLGLGSAGTARDRLDEHSDLDFFVVVEDGAAARYRKSTDWLRAPCAVAFSFANDPHGRKALYADGIFVEYAVFTVAELARLPRVGARVVWRRADVPAALVERGPEPGGPPYDTVGFHLNEALTNLYVGLHRELRGERLSATRFIQSYAVDRVLALLDLTGPGGVRAGRDPFDPSRRAERAYPPEVVPLAAMVPGYRHNRAAAGTVLAWLAARFPVDPALGAAIRRLLDDPSPESPEGTPADLPCR